MCFWKSNSGIYIVIRILSQVTKFYKLLYTQGETITPPHDAHILMTSSFLVYILCYEIMEWVGELWVAKSVCCSCRACFCESSVMKRVWVCCWPISKPELPTLVCVTRGRVMDIGCSLLLIPGFWWLFLICTWWPANTELGLELIWLVMVAEFAVWNVKFWLWSWAPENMVGVCWMVPRVVCCRTGWETVFDWNTGWRCDRNNSFSETKPF